MKAKLFALFVTLLMVGCGESSQHSEDVDTTDTVPKKDAIETAVDWSKLQDRDGVIYLANTQEPFSGYAKRAYGNEQVEVLAQLKDGYVVRLKQWQENGTPRWDVGFVEGKVGVEGMPYITIEREPKLKEYGHGPVTIWHVNGQKQGEGNYKDGKLIGLVTGWYENGQRRELANWKDGKRHGLVTQWYENGQKFVEVNYKDGKRVGALNEWYENGQKLRETNYKDDKRDGLRTKWYENGQKSYEKNYKDFKMDGLSTGWYENGQKQGEGNFKDGKLMSAVHWKPNGEKCPVTNVKDGNGVMVFYNEDGTEKSRRTYKDGDY